MNYELIPQLKRSQVINYFNTLLSQRAPDVDDNEVFTNFKMLARFYYININRKENDDFTEIDKDKNMFIWFTELYQFINEFNIQHVFKNCDFFQVDNLDPSKYDKWNNFRFHFGYFLSSIVMNDIDSFKDPRLQMMTNEYWGFTDELLENIRYAGRASNYHSALSIFILLQLKEYQETGTVKTNYQELVLQSIKLSEYSAETDFNKMCYNLLNKDIAGNRYSSKKDYSKYVFKQDFKYNYKHFFEELNNAYKNLIIEVSKGLDMYLFTMFMKDIADKNVQIEYPVLASNRDILFFNFNIARIYYYLNDNIKNKNLNYKFIFFQRELPEYEKSINSYINELYTMQLNELLQVFATVYPVEVGNFRFTGQVYISPVLDFIRGTNNQPLHGSIKENIKLEPEKSPKKEKSQKKEKYSKPDLLYEPDESIIKPPVKSPKSKSIGDIVDMILSPKKSPVKSPKRSPMIIEEKKVEKVKKVEKPKKVEKVEKPKKVEKVEKAQKIQKIKSPRETGPNGLKSKNDYKKAIEQLIDKKQILVILKNNTNSFPSKYYGKLTLGELQKLHDMIIGKKVVLKQVENNPRKSKTQYREDIEKMIDDKKSILKILAENPTKFPSRYYGKLKLEELKTLYELLQKKSK